MCAILFFARWVFNPRTCPNFVHRCFLWCCVVSVQWAHWAHAGRASLAAEHLCIVGSNMHSRWLFDTACLGTQREHLITWVLGFAVCTHQSKRGGCTVVIFYSLKNCSAQGSPPLFPEVLRHCCASWWAHWVQAGLVTRRLGRRGGVSASSINACTMGRWLAQRAWAQSLHTRFRI